jgi:hypothetical protein
MNDVLTKDGRKIAGAAIKRTQRCLLLQGSIDRGALPDDLDFIRFADHLETLLAQTLGLKPHQPEDLRPIFNSGLIARETARFADPDWTRRR